MRFSLKMLLFTSPLWAAVAALCQEQTAKTLNVDVEIVLVNVSVVNTKNEVVTGLDAEDFRVFEDKVEQKIQYFSTEAAPISLGIIFDVSGSMEAEADVARDAALTFLKNSTGQDEYFLVPFNGDARLEHDFTRDISRIEASLKRIGPRGATSLYDALYLGLSHVRNGVNARKALLLITDGFDNSSRYTRRNVRDLIREADVQIYTIDMGQAYVKEFSDLTGGHSYHTSKSGVWETSRKIAAELKNQYVLGYVPTNTKKDEAWRKIQVRIDSPRGKGLTIRARQGYYAN